MRATSGSRAERPPLTLVVVAAAFFGLAVPRAATAGCPGGYSTGNPISCAYCDNYQFEWYDSSQCVPCYGVYSRCPRYWAWCDGRTPQFADWSDCEDWSILATYYPSPFDLGQGCAYSKQVHGYPPAEVCGDGADEDCDGLPAACTGCTNPSASVGQTASCTTSQGCQGSMTCGSNGTWGACTCGGCTNPSAPVGGLASCSAGQCTNGTMTCGSNGTWGACSVASDCSAPTQPPGTQPQTSDPISEMNAGCPNGDWGGYDPIQLPLRSASTLPFTDFEVTVLRPLGVTRTYSSSDVMAGDPPGIFGLGWHYNWDTTLKCSGNGASCTVDTGAAGKMKLAAQTGTVVGVGALSGEALVLYQRTEPANVAAGGNNLMVRRPNGEFILFQLDGSELHFVQPAVCGSCMDASFNGTLRLTRDVDPAGRSAQLNFTASGKLLTVTDDLGNMLSLSPSATCSSRAGALSYRAGTDGVESVYVTYTYDSTCQVLKTVVPSNFAAAPNHSAQLRAYDYQSSPKVGLLTKVYNEFNDPVTVFGYDSSTGRATSLLDAHSSLSVTYPQPNQDQVVSAYGSESSTVTTNRGAAGKATSITERANWGGPADPSIVGSGSANYWTRAQVWDGQYLVCTETLVLTRYFQRDAQKRVTFLADYRGGGDPQGAACSSTPWTSLTPLRSWKFEYGIVKQVAQGVTLGLSMTTKTSQQSVFAAQLAQSAGSGTNPDTFQTFETLDYDPTSKPGDPAGYSCGTSGLPVGGLVCRKIVAGYTNDANGMPTLQRLGTFFSYDARGRLVRSVGPLYLVGQPPAGNVDPVEDRTYWPDDDPDPMKRGRLHQITRWANTARALTTSFATYDVFGPTQVQDPAGGTTIYTRAGSAGRVTRIDTPDGRHTTTRYYDGNLPRLQLSNGGSARRFTYDDKGRLHAIEPLSGDPESGSVTQGWIETRDHDLAGNTTLVTRADAQGTVRWKQIFDYYWNGALRKNIHPEAGKGYALWSREWDGTPYRVFDEENNAIAYARDKLFRVQYLWVAAPDEFTPNHGGILAWPPAQPGISYEYEPGQDALSRVWNVNCSHCYDHSALIAGYVHDDFERLLSVSAPTTMTAGPYTYAYDARGNVVQRSGGGSLIQYRYDGVNRMTRLTATRTADGSSFQYDYAYDDPSAIGRLHSITEPGRTTTFTCDEVGRTRFEVVAETDAATSLTSEYRYDADGDLSEVITPAGLDVKYERDPATKDVTKVWNVTSGTEYASDVTHLPAGPISALTFAGGATLTQSFNLRYEPSSIASGPVALGYEISPAGNPKRVGSTTYTYDLRGRVISETPFQDTRYAFTFADVGSTPSSRMIGASIVPWASGVTPQPKFAFGYDNGSNLSAISTYNATGSSITGTTCLVHDALGRLTAVGPAKVQAGPDARACTSESESDLASVTVRFQYDARNRRVARQDGTGPWKYWVFSPDGRPLAEMWKPSSSGGAWSVQREYVWLDGRPLAQVEYPGTSGRNEGDVYLVHVDHLGQPRALTSMAGAVVWSSTPRAYGEIVETTAPDPANGRTVVTNLRLPGQYDERLLGAIGLSGPYYNNARWYLPAMARYMELDPVALLGGMNGKYAPDWYGYANQNPLRWTDPRGEEVIGAIVGGVFGAISGGFSAYTISHSLWAAAGSAIIGGAFGAGMGLLDPTLGIGTMAFIGGAASGAGNVAGTLWGMRPGQWGSLSDVSLVGLAGSIFGGAAAGAFGGVINVYGGGEAAAIIAGGFVSGLTTYLGDVEGAALANGGTLPVPTPTPGRAMAGWGCKP